MNKQDIRHYSDQELSLLVFNNEYLYNMRHRRQLWRVLDDTYWYTPEQMTELERDLEDDLLES